MNTELKIKGTQIFMGVEIPVIEGGFGEGSKSVSVVSIHKIRVSDINASIWRLINKNRIKEGVDFINLLSESVSLREFVWTPRQVVEWGLYLQSNRYHGW